MADVRINQGDTFLVNGLYKDANGDPVNLTAAGITIKSGVASNDGLQKYCLTVTLGDQASAPGTYTIEGDTAAWKAGKGLQWIVRFKQAGRCFSTKIFSIDVREVPL